MKLKIFPLGCDTTNVYQHIATLMLALLFSTILLTLAGFIIAHFVNYPLITREGLFAPFSLEMPSWYLAYGPHPKQHLIFIALVLLSPFFCLFSIFISRKIGFIFFKRISHYFSNANKWIFFGLSVIFLFLIFIYFSESYFAGKILFFISRNPRITTLLISVPLFGVLIIMFFSGCFLSRLSKRTIFLIKSLFFSVVIFAVLFNIFSFRLMNFNFLTYLVDWQKGWHLMDDLEPVFYPVVQVIYGKTLLSNVNALYGLYAEILNPIFKIIGLSLFKFSLVMEALEGLIFSAFLWITYKLTKSVLLSSLFVLSISLIGSALAWVIGYDFPSPYYQYWPIRVIFPVLSLCLFVHFANQMSISKVVIMGFLTAIAFFWNFESAIPIFAATIAYFFCLLIFPVFQNKQLYLRLVVSYFSAIFIFLLLFALYLEIKSNFTVQWKELFKYSLIFYKSGLSQMPMPIGISMWMVVVLTYLVGMIYAFYLWMCGKASVLTMCIFYISILGIGLFTYYEYRAVPFNLVTVSWPAILLGLIFSNIFFEKVRQARLSLIATLFVFPFICFTVVTSEVYLYSMPYLYKKSVIIWHAMQQPDRHSKLTRDYLFIKDKLQGSKNIAILIDGQSVLFDKLGVASAIDGPGYGGTFLKSDYDDVVKQLITKPVQHVFIDVNSKRLPALLLKYVKKGVTVDGTVHLVPK